MLGTFQIVLQQPYGDVDDFFRKCTRDTSFGSFTIIVNSRDGEAFPT